MCRQDLAFWCFAFLLVSSSQSQKNSANDDEHNSMVQYDANLMKNRSDETKLITYNSHKNFTKDNETQRQFRVNSMGSNRENYNMTEYEFHLHSTKDHQGGNQMPTELRTKANIKNDSVSHDIHQKLIKLEEGKDNSASHKPHENFTQNINNFTLHGNFSKNGNESDTLTYEMCNNNTCIQLCCPRGDRLINDKCVSEKGNYSFPVYMPSDSSQNKERKLDEVFHLIINDPCKYDRYVLNPEDYPEDEYTLLANGSLYQPHYNEFIELTSYCLAVVNGDQYEVVICFSNETKNATLPDLQRNDIPVVGLIISLPFLLATFVVYSILPELRNMHGYTLRGYVGSLFVAYTVLAMLQLINPAILPDSFCIALAFVIHFSFLASFFWLNVMCFDIWWTFGGFRSLQGSVKQREKKKFIIYSIYAWGSASILTIVCAIMDFVPSVPEHLIRPEFGTDSCWFTTDAAKALYFYGPMGITIVCNICLFISTALKIVRHKKDTAHHLRGSESRRHDDNKQWFSLYLKLFIVMGINWSMEIVSWLIKSAPQYVWYLTDLTNTLQGLIIFIIFVWKEKIKRLLLKRFGCQDRDFFSRNSTRSGVHSTSSRTCTTSTGVMPLQVKISPYVQTNCRTKSSSDEADP